LKFSIVIVTFLFGFLSSSCGTSAIGVSKLAPQTYQISQDQVVRIEVNSGEVLVTGSQGDTIEVLGTLTQDKTLVYSVEQNNAGLHILARYPKRFFPLPATNPINLEIRIPAGVQVQFDTQDANLTVQDFSGKLEVSSVAGNVQVDGLDGIVTLKVNRGEVMVQNSRGELNALGNYGLLSFVDAHGQVNASTIMGTVSYQGAPKPGDAFHFETDHGPVQIDLTDQPNLLVDVHSTSGEVVCMFSALKREPRDCGGKLGDGSSRLDVRTVSGNIILRQVP
jgi:hypothetical protein